MPFPIPPPDRFLTRLQPSRHNPSPPPPPFIFLLPLIITLLVLIINLYLLMPTHLQVLLIISITLSIIALTLTISKVEKYLSSFSLTVLYFLLVTISTSVIVSIIYAHFFTP